NAICRVSSAVKRAKVNCVLAFFFSSRRRHTRFSRDWSSDVCSSDLTQNAAQTAHELSPQSYPIRACSAIRLATGSACRSRQPFQIGRASCRERVSVLEVGEYFEKEIMM